MNLTLADIVARQGDAMDSRYHPTSANGARCMAFPDPMVASGRRNRLVKHYRPADHRGVSDAVLLSSMGRGYRGAP